MKKAIYPGTFDPVTVGHLDVMRRAAQISDHLIVAVAENRRKNTWFDLEERVRLVRESVADLKNVEVTSFTGLLVEYARSQKVNFIVRGLRAFSDFEYEFQMVGMNQRLDRNIETVFLMADPTCQAIASRLVKEIARLNGDVSEFAPPAVVSRLKAKFG